MAHVALVAKPTQYAGNSFRSRLEARWCYFFRELGLSYKYEPESFYWPDGLGYLPDFRLTIPLLMYMGDGRYQELETNGSRSNTRVWIEVKPLGKELTSKEQDKITRFARDHGLVLLQGDPLEYKANYLVRSRGARHKTLVYFVWTGRRVGLLNVFTQDSNGKRYFNLPEPVRDRQQTVESFLNQVTWSGPLRELRLKARRKRFD